LKQKSTDVDWSEAGRKSWDTIRNNAKAKRSHNAGKKAEKTITDSERYYIDELIKTQKLSRTQIFHHLGLPDLMVVTNNGKVKFYEIKPKKAGSKRTLLNINQAKAIREGLKNDRVEEIGLVKYTKLGKGKQAKYVYDAPIKLTSSNLDKYTIGYKA
jgi:hypothetical protein